tara:strand:+ start:43 stop:633 length:591 start_codon:yes stop_codon:yes gene_type:complete
MIKFLLCFLISALLPSSIIDTVWIDDTLSTMSWIGNKVTGSHNGKIKIKNGYILKKDDLLMGGEIIIDMNSISVDDIEHPKWNEGLVSHLKNEDFFHVDKFSVSKLKITSSRKSFIDDKMSSNIEIFSDLTIKNITKPISFHAYVDFERNESSGELIIDRTKWNIKYGSSSFFKDLGDRAIYDDFIINFKLVSKKD